MTEQAGDTKQGLLWKQEHLAPLPIPTGQPASDLMNIVWRKNQVYLDIGNFSMGAGWLTLHALTFLILTVAIWAALSGDIWGGILLLGIMGGGLWAPSGTCLSNSTASR